MTDLLEQLQASLGDAYVIERELGAGMSRVFVARETSLGRHVVVKVLPDDLSGSVSIARFRREISLAARLQHPHIVPLLAAGEIDGLPYYIMPFVEGESLRARLSHGELPLAETISVLRDVARALSYAHGKGVAHRDIKPDNVLLAGTSAVITDFGVAKALSESAVSGPLTSIGITLGTPTYMAPEQAAADPATDLRADIYAFGVMAFEMLAGHPPFAGRSPHAMLAAHATETPPSIAALRPATPAPLADLVMRCLEKRPGDRPQSADEILAAIDMLVTPRPTSVSTSELSTRPSRHLATRGRTMRVGGVLAGIAVCLMAVVVWWRARAGDSAGSPIRSIAVLPFENTSGDTSFDYLEDGITDHVRDALNAIPGLTVKARSSSHQLKGRDAREVGSKLGVGAVLQGTVSRSSTRLHVTAELVRASDDNALWSGTFDGQPTELAGMQDSIARAIEGRLQLNPTDIRSNKVAVHAARGTVDINAYDRFLKGRHAFDRLDFATASKYFRDAIALDPRFARAHAYLAMTYANTPTLGQGSVESSNALARASADRALGLDSTVAEAYVAESFILVNEMRLVESIKPLEKALMIDSSNADVLSPYALILVQVGRVAEGLVQARRAVARDPLSSTSLGILGYILGLSRQYDVAITQSRMALDVDPRNVLVYQGLGFFFAFNGMPDSSVTAFETAFKLDSTIWGGRTNLVFAYAVAGRWNEAARQRALLNREASGNSPNYYRMIVDLAYGDYSAAMTALDRAVAMREPLAGIVSIPCDPRFDPLKSDPRFAVLMQRLGARACPATGTWPIAPHPR